MTSLLEVDSLSVRYGKASAVRRASLTVERGSLVAIVGPNGAGKSSLLLGIQGVVRADATALNLDGRSILGTSATQRAKRGMVLVPQGRQVFPTLRVRDNLRVVADALALERDSVDDALDRFPILRQRAKVPAGLLSGGEQQMLAMARALMCRPEVLLLDEPTEGLAPSIVSQILDVLDDIQAGGGTVVIAGPTTRVLPEKIDVGVVMMRGELVATATDRRELQDAFRDQYGGEPIAS